MKSLSYLMSGGLSETPLHGGLVGPTFACIIAGQFRSLMKADRFFFTHPERGEDKERGLGTSATRRSVQARRLGDILCDNTRDPETGINFLQELVMESKAKAGNTKLPCDGSRGTPGRDLDWGGTMYSTPTKSAALSLTTKNLHSYIKI